MDQRWSGHGHIVIFGHSIEGRARLAPLQRYLVGITVGISRFIDRPEHGSVPGAQERLGCRGHSQPEPLISRLDPHRHLTLVPQRAVSAGIVLIYSYYARPPVGVGVRVEVSQEVDRDLFCARLG